MAEQTEASEPDPGLWKTLGDVVAELRGEYPLLFGIGGGLVLVVVLGITGNVGALAIVAGLLVVSLVTWIVWKTIDRRRISAGKRTQIRRGSAVADVSKEVPVDQLRVELGDDSLLDDNSAVLRVREE
jgi:hypothetical protein